MDFSFLWRIATWLTVSSLAIATFLLTTIYNYGRGWIEGILTSVTIVTGVDVESALPYLEMANYWFPLDHCFAAIVALVTFWAVYAAIKISIKLIPFVG